MRNSVISGLVVLVCLCGCRDQDDAPDKAKKQADKVSSPEQVPPVRSVVRERYQAPNDPLRADLQKLADMCAKLDTHMARKVISYSNVEDLGWKLSLLGKALVSKYRYENAKRGKIDLAERKDLETGLRRWKDLPDEIRDLDLIADNGHRLGLAAALMETGKVRVAYVKIAAIAERCFPKVVIVPEGLSLESPQSGKVDKLKSPVVNEKVDPVKPAESPKPVDSPKPVESPKPVDSSKPIEIPEPVKKVPAS